MFRDQDDDNTLALCKVRRASNCYRLYTMRRSRTLWGTPAIQIVWGRMGKRLRERIEDFPDEQSRERRWAELARRRVRHGYVLHEPSTRVPLARAVPVPDLVGPARAASA